MFPSSATNLCLSMSVNRRQELRGLLGADRSLRFLADFFLVTLRTGFVEHEVESGEEGGAEDDRVAGVVRRQEDILLVKAASKI